MDICAAVKSGRFISVKIARVRDGNVLDVLGTTVETYDDNDEDESTTLDLAEACQRTIESTYASAQLVSLPDSVYIPTNSKTRKKLEWRSSRSVSVSVWLKRRRMKRI